MFKYIYYIGWQGLYCNSAINRLTTFNIFSNMLDIIVNNGYNILVNKKIKKGGMYMENTNNVKKLKVNRYENINWYTIDEKDKWSVLSEIDYWDEDGLFEFQ